MRQQSFLFPNTTQFQERIMIHEVLRELNYFPDLVQDTRHTSQTTILFIKRMFTTTCVGYWCLMAVGISSPQKT